MFSIMGILHGSKASLSAKWKKEMAIFWIFHMEQ